MNSLNKCRFPRLPIFAVALVALGLSGERVATAQLILGKATGLGAPINTPGNEHAPDLTGDGLTMFFDRGHTAAQSRGNRDLYVSTRDSIGAEWSEPLPLDAVNTPAFEVNPSISDDGQTLAFADGFPTNSANLRPNGLGSADIWISSWNLETSSWTEPENIGEPINSRFNDYGPEFSADNLSLYFSSDRPGGFGGGDIWVSTRKSIDSEWMEPINLGPHVNGSGNDDVPSISRDERILIFTSTRPGGSGAWDQWISTRDTKHGEWGEPVNLGDAVNTSAIEHNAEISADGSTLLFSRCCGGDGELWQVPLSPLESVPVTVGGNEYTQNFDAALSSSGAAGSKLPAGWTATNSGVIHENSTTQDFPLAGRSRVGSVFNAGEDGHQDRALAIGATRVNSRTTQAPILQLLSEVNGTDAAAFQLQFDLEAWDADSRANTPGVAAFDVSVEVDSGDGFHELRDVGTVTTSELSLPEGEYLNGNLDKNQFVFDSGPQSAMIPAGSTLRLRWELPESAQSGGWVFGLDNVKLNLFGSLIDAFDCNGDGALDVFDADCAPAVSLDGTLAAAGLIKGDANGDGDVEFSDFLILSTNFSNVGQYTDGDFDKDGEVQFSDFLILSDNFGQSAATAAAVPEPSSSVWLVGCAFGWIAIRRKGRSH